MSAKSRFSCIHLFMVVRHNKTRPATYEFSIFGAETHSRTCKKYVPGLSNYVENTEDDQLIPCAITRSWIKNITRLLNVLSISSRISVLKRELAADGYFARTTSYSIVICDLIPPSEVRKETRDDKP